MEASMIFNCSRTTAATLPNIFAFWQMLDIRAWQNFMKTARHLLRNPNTMLWRKERNREIASWLGNELWLSIFFVNWKSFASWARGIAIAERDLLCVSTWSLLSTTLNSTQIDFCKRSNESCAIQKRPTKRAPDAGDSAAISGSFYALAFFWLDGFAVPAPAQVTQTVGRWY